jgi:hypothetical protein
LNEQTRFPMKIKEGVMDDPIKEIVEVLRANPSLLNALLFDPEAIASHLKSREAKALVYGIDPKAFIQSLTRRAVAPLFCGKTCGALSCDGTCGELSCKGTCGDSCGSTCDWSCSGETTKAQ